ncbi:MAG: bifunctional demethylmenaquinone methyltransferase/2-methoxy-6-polyprenyl-1,4-benzoquinol methylase UbiE [Planctomycetota bacterium]
MTSLRADAERVPESSTQAWNARELSNPHAHDEKADKVRSMFTAIARSYDFNNRVHSLWMDVRWRRIAVAQAAVSFGDEVLDVACGTGDLTEAFANHSDAARVVGCDFTEGMLDLARVKQRRLPQSKSSRVTYEWADAQQLPFETNSFDIISIAFGIRNVQRPADTFAEFARVLRPGGRLIVLEFDTPRNPLVRAFNTLYAGRIMPITATLLSGDRSGAYRYLPKSVASFASREELSAMMTTAGFTTPSVTSLSFGICACYAAHLPRNA